MSPEIQEWVLGFQCSRCAFVGIQKLGTVHVLGKDDKGEIQVVAFCYDCARVMMSRRRPRPNRYGPMPAPTGHQTIVKALVHRNDPKRAKVPPGDVSRALLAETSRCLEELSWTVKLVNDEIESALRLMRSSTVARCDQAPMSESSG